MAFLRSVTMIGLFTLLSRGFGFIRDLMIAGFLGSGPVADAFVVAQRLPNAFRSVFAEGAMDTAFVPIYTRKRQKELPESVQDFTNHIFTILLIVLLPLTGLAILFMPHVVAAIAPGFVGDAQRFSLAVTYSNITFSYLLLISLTSLQGGLLNANGHFGPYASAPAILNVVMIIGFIIAARLDLDPAIIGSWALIAGGLIQMLVLILSCRRYGLSMRLSRPRLTVDVKQFFKLVGPGAIGTGIDQINIMIMTIMASTLPSGAVAALYYADRLTQLPLGVIGGAVATALLPALTRHIALKEESSTTHYFSRAIEITLILCIPASLALLLIPEPIVRILYQHGVFDANSTKTTVETIVGYALTIPASVLVRIFMVRFFAHENAKIPVIVSLISIIFNVVASFYLKSIWQHFGIALAYSLTMWTVVSLLWFMLARHGYAELEKSTWKKLPGIVISTIAMSAVLLASRYPAEVITGFISGKLVHMIAALAIRIALSVAAYMLALYITGTVRRGDLHAMFRNV